MDKKAFAEVDTKEKTIVLDTPLTKKEVKKIEKKLRKAGCRKTVVAGVV